MQKASRLLETSPAGVAEVAKRVGYDAEAAFSKAFKRWIGVAPGAYRRGGIAGSSDASFVRERSLGFSQAVSRRDLERIAPGALPDAGSCWVDAWKGHPLG
jgi:AraC-like DNA-binding protein